MKHFVLIALCIAAFCSCKPEDPLPKNNYEVEMVMVGTKIKAHLYVDDKFIYTSKVSIFEGIHKDSIRYGYNGNLPKYTYLSFEDSASGGLTLTYFENGKLLFKDTILPWKFTKDVYVREYFTENKGR